MRISAEKVTIVYQCAKCGREQLQPMKRHSSIVANPLCMKCDRVMQSMGVVIGDEILEDRG